MEIMGEREGQEKRQLSRPRVRGTGGGQVGMEACKGQVRWVLGPGTGGGQVGMGACGGHLVHVQHGGGLAHGAQVHGGLAAHAQGRLVEQHVDVCLKLGAPGAGVSASS